MRKLLFTTAFCFLLTLSAYGQTVQVLTKADECPADKVCVSQSTIDKAAKAADELLAARDALAKFAAERTVHDAERKAAAVLIDNLNVLVATGQRIQDEQTKVIALYKSVMEMQAGIIERLEKMLSKPKSGWAKFADILKTVAAVLSGVVLGRAGL